MNKLILTKEVAQKLLNAQKLGHFVVLASFDLGKTTQSVRINADSCTINGNKVPFGALKKFKEGTCYVLEGGEFKSIDFFGEDTNLYYKLKPTNDWPTLTLSSVPMHRFRHVSPKEDTKTKILEVSPVRGVVLDTCCGIGYTAIGAARDAKEVVVFEKDKNVLRIAGYNPFSEELFTNKKIKIKNEDVFGGIKKLKADYFDRIIHDPPTVSFSPELYSKEFYGELFRVAKPGAIIYHYCPNPGKTNGTEFWPRIKERLEKAGFKNCVYSEKASGIRCVRP